MWKGKVSIIEWNEIGTLFVAESVVHDANTGAVVSQCSLRIQGNRFVRSPSAMLSTEGSDLLLGYTNDQIYLWEAASGRVLREYSGENRGSLCYAARGDICASCSRMNTITVWSLVDNGLNGSCDAKMNVLPGANPPGLKIQDLQFIGGDGLLVYLPTGCQVWDLHREGVKILFTIRFEQRWNKLALYANLEYSPNENQLLCLLTEAVPGRDGKALHTLVHIDAATGRTISKRSHESGWNVSFRTGPVDNVILM